jgi:hypothetical protein
LRRGNKKTPMSIWRCGHFSPVVVEELEGGKMKSARCLVCGERGPVREGSEEALRALRDLARQRDEALSA